VKKSTNGSKKRTRTKSKQATKKRNKRVSAPCMMSLTPEEQWNKVSIVTNGAIPRTNRGDTVLGLGTGVVAVSTITDLLKKDETIYRCEECSSTDVDMIQKQIRGADEPMTCFFTCQQCKNRWTEN
jgi:DNA-directed RNA polymerase subunit M/transcription elongation factor TFIIS